MFISVSLSSAASGDVPVDAGLPCNELRDTTKRAHYVFNSSNGKFVLCGIGLMMIRYFLLGMATKINEVVNKNIHK